MTNLKKKLKKMKVKQRELAQKSNISYSVVGHQCKEGIKTMRVAKRYAKILGCDWTELIG